MHPNNTLTPTASTTIDAIMDQFQLSPERDYQRYESVETNDAGEPWFGGPWLTIGKDPHRHRVIATGEGGALWSHHVLDLVEDDLINVELPGFKDAHSLAQWLDDQQVPVIADLWVRHLTGDTNALATVRPLLSRLLRTAKRLIATTPPERVAERVDGVFGLMHGVALAESPTTSHATLRALLLDDQYNTDPRITINAFDHPNMTDVTRVEFALLHGGMLARFRQMEPPLSPF